MYATRKPLHLSNFIKHKAIHYLLYGKSTYELTTVRWQSQLYFSFQLNEYLEDDSKNIMCSLLRMVTFIKQRKLEDKTEKDIYQITEFSLAAWEFLTTVRTTGWKSLVL